MRDASWAWRAAGGLVDEIKVRVIRTAVLGEPPTVRWRRDDGSTVLVRNLEIAVTVTWASKRSQDEWDRIADAPA